MSAGKGLFYPLLAHDNRDAQLLVEPAHQSHELGSGQRIELGRGLVEHEHGGVGGHNGRQVQALALTARQIGGRAVEPPIEAEEARRLGDTRPGKGRIAPKAFQAEGHLAGHPVGNNLVARILHDEPDAPGLLAPGHFL